MKKISLPLIVVINLVFMTIGLLAWRIPFSGLLSDFYFNRAFTEFLVNGMESSEARDYLTRAIEIDPENYGARYYLAHSFYLVEDYQNAAQEFQSYVAISPLNSSAHFQLAESYFKLGQYDLATQSYVETLRLEPLDVDYLDTSLKRFQVMGRDAEYFSTLYQLATYTADPSERIKFSNELSQLFENSSEAIDVGTGVPLGFGRQSSAGVTPDGRLYILAHSRRFPNLVVVSVSEDEGETWTVTKVLYVAYIANGADGVMALGPDGSIHLFYGDRGGPSIYTNTTSDFNQKLLVSAVGDSRQLAVDSDGHAHMVWFNEKDSIYYSEVSDSEFVGQPESVGAGLFPSLALEGVRVIVTYNVSANFPDPTGGVLISERVDGQWSKGDQISTSGVWAGASVVKSINGLVHVLYIENSVSGPLLVHAWRDALGTWKYALVDEHYIPFIPKGLAFGGRTSPAIQSVGNKIYFLWRSGSESSPIILKSFDLGTEQMGSSDILDTLEDAVFSSAPSFLTARSQTEGMNLLWAKDDAAVFEPGSGLP
ncbi:MAG: hypothetical protein HY863_11545 [Chloroflexi bacterium]|nr:hypothetical protein [Chloroflexota bacterium]